MDDPGHDRYEEYTKEQLEWRLRQSPRHQDRDILLRYFHAFQQKEADQKADQEAAKRTEKAELDERKLDRRYKFDLAAKIVTIVLAVIGTAIGLSKCLLDRPPATDAPSTTQPASISPSATTQPTIPAPLSPAKSELRETPQLSQSPPLSPTPTPIKFPPPAP